MRRFSAWINSFFTNLSHARHVYHTLTEVKRELNVCRVKIESMEVQIARLQRTLVEIRENL